jgi:ABC-2 type transport system ATP-binding protein
MSQNDNVIEVRGLTKHYGHTVVVERCGTKTGWHLLARHAAALGLAEILMKDASGLDPQATAEFLESIHLLERVQSVCDRVALFSSGRITLIGSVPELATQVLGGGYHVEVEADGKGLGQMLAAVPGVRAIEQLGPGRFRLLSEGDVRPQAAAAVVNAGRALLRLSFEEPSLGAIYNRYFQDQGVHQGPPHVT